MKPTPRSTLLFLLCAFTLAACSSILAPVPDRWRFFNLTPLPSNDGSAPAWSAAGTVYGLGPVTLPSYLDRDEIAARLSPTEVAYSRLDRWAEPLPAQVPSILLQNLSTLLPGNRVVTYPWHASAQVTEQIEVTFRQLECGPQAECTLDARWLVRDMKTGSFQQIRDTRLITPRPAGDTSDAAPLSELLGQLSREIATALPVPKRAK